jgi:ABC-type multidrug transport system ATPase subunit
LRRYILGPSGAGKTTLLDILAGRPSLGHKLGGELRVNGKLMTSADMRAVSGYVPQAGAYTRSLLSST